MSEKDIQKKGNSPNIVQVFTVVISIAFIGSFFMYGAIFRLMAIGEIMIGFVFI